MKCLTDSGVEKIMSPKVSEFLGIKIIMRFNETEKPHFHATYGGETIQVFIQDGKVVGKFKKTPLKYIRLWLKRNRPLLEENWALAMAKQPLKWIDDEDM